MVEASGTVEKLAAWVLGVRAEDLPEAAVTQAKLLLLDTIGCGFAALDEETAQALLAVVEASGGAPQCTVIGGTHRTSAANATLANGALVRILDFNDYVGAKTGDLGGHPSDNIPVALAAGELCGASGREIIAAIVLGYEIFGRAKELMERDSAWDGVTVSGLAAPAMAGRLMGLDRARLAHAIALSGARAATSTAVRFGDISAAKSIANALVAQNGMQAALLAERGITGPLDLFENPRGMREVFSKGDAVAVLTAPLSAESVIMEANVKAFPCLATGQSVVAAGIEMHRRLGGAVDGLDRLQARDRGHAGAAPAEGRPGPHQADLARGGRPQLQFSRRGLAHRRRVRARPVRRRALERPASLRAHGAARDRQRQLLEHARARQLSLLAAWCGRGTGRNTSSRSPTRPGFRAAGSTPTW